MNRTRLAALGVIAREEHRRALETRWLFGFAVAFAAIVLGLSYFGLAQSREIGFQGFGRVTLSLLNLVLLIVPLTGLVLGVASVAGDADGLALLLAQPVGRDEVLLGKFLGLGAALTAAQALGFGGGGLVIALLAGSAQLPGFIVLAGLSFVLGLLSIACALWIAVVAGDRVRALAVALLGWFAAVVGYDLAVLGLTAMLGGLPLQAVLFPALLLNPIDLTRVLVTLAVGSGALFGPTAATLARWFGVGGGAALGAVVLVVETLAPLALAIGAFRRRDG
jgi:Cu-processing system permease protein